MQTPITMVWKVLALCIVSAGEASTSRSSLEYKAVRGDLKVPVPTEATHNDRRSSDLVIELQRNGNRLAMIRRGGDNSTYDCELFGSRQSIDKILALNPDLPVHNVSKTAFREIVQECEGSQLGRMAGTREKIKHQKLMKQNRHEAGVDERIEKRADDFQRVALGVELWDGIYPGTKWCGSGSIADDYDDLGSNEATDQCCRTHDHCDRNICPLCTDEESGLFNLAIYTRSHCDCDTEFKQCLKAASNEDADSIGWIFYDGIDISCYWHYYPWSCLDRAWWGYCYDYGFDTNASQRWYFHDQPGY